jgi:hypothetical protein
MFYDHQYKAHLKYTNLLIFTSVMFFLVPCIYAYYYNLYFYSSILFIEILISINYWRKPTYSWRRTLDLFFAKVLLIIFTITGIMNVNYTPYIILGYSGLFLALYFYYLSEKYSNLKNKLWYRYHILFHFIAMLEILLVLNSIK